MLWVLASTALAAEEEGVFVRFRMTAPEGAHYYVKLGGYTHVPNWRLPDAVIPTGADRKPEARLGAGEFSPWFDLKTHAGKLLHERQNRAGGVAEYANVTASFVTEPAAPGGRVEVEIELAMAADPAKVVKRWQEAFTGSETSFLVSPHLAANAAELETATEMTARRLRWAEEATGGVRHSPKNLLIQTQLWGPQRPELNLQDARILSLLGFNIVGNVQKELRGQFPEFRAPAASHDVRLGPESSREDVKGAWAKMGAGWKDRLDAGAPFNFQDEVVARPPMGTSETARRQFHEWLAAQKVTAGELGVSGLDEVVPIETPEILRERMKTNEAAARRIFYYTSRYRQHALTERLAWNTEELHRQAGPAVLSSTLVADHPYFGGTGLGMGMDEQNDTWGGWPLAADWFEIGRSRVVDLIGIEDWMGLQFMYGPASTWEGFQLMGFQAAIFRSASRTEPIIAWVTPSDERNLRLKFASALCQGAKHLYYWSYGPTSTCTENYWSDQKGCYPGMAHVSRMLEFAEPVVAPGKLRPTRVALLYPISSDLWQPFGYLHMLERRGLYLALVHAQYLVDFLAEEDVTAGRLGDYRVLYTADPCISEDATGRIAKWVEGGGTLVATCAAGTRNEFGEHVPGLDEVLGVDRSGAPEVQPGKYRLRGGLNEIAQIGRMEPGGLELIGMRQSVRTKAAQVSSKFADNDAPAVTENRFGKGRAVNFAMTPAVSYLKAAKFVPAELAEKWPATYRQFITAPAQDAGAMPLVKMSVPVVEAGAYDSDGGSALVLANFTYEPIASLEVEIPMRKKVTAVRSLAHGVVKFESSEAPKEWREEGYEYRVRFSGPLDLDDVYVLDAP